jgi:hypothetical protein
MGIFSRIIIYFNLQSRHYGFKSNLEYSNMDLLLSWITYLIGRHNIRIVTESVSQICVPTGVFNCNSEICLLTEVHAPLKN